MEKEKLIVVRKQKGFSQQTMANHLCMDVSNYNRREKGKIKISFEEWEKLAQLLQVNLGEIYEIDSTDCNIDETCTIPIHLLEIQWKYIQSLEKEINELKKE